MVHILQNDFWRIGVLPEIGAGIAFGQIPYQDNWLDIFRQTPSDQYNNPSAISSFLMLPWANRIRDGRFTFDGKSYALQTTKDDGTARHGDVRKRAWTLIASTDTQLTCSLQSADFADFNFPFVFSAHITFALVEDRFDISVSIRNQDTVAMPCGFGHHPYFVKPIGDNAPHLQTPCDQYYDLSPQFIPDRAPTAITPELDFQLLRPVGDNKLDHLLTHLDHTQPTRLVYPVWQRALNMTYDDHFKHMLIYTPSNENSIAVEPMTMATDGFNLWAKGIENGVWILQPNETKTARVSFMMANIG